MSDNLVHTNTDTLTTNNEVTNNNISNTSTTTTTNTNTNTGAAPITLSPNVITLKEAFPDIDVEIIEVILQNHQNNVEASFESLLNLSDPNYQTQRQQQEQQQQQSPPSPPSRLQQQQQDDNDPSAPPKPPRPGQPISPEEQMRLDEEFAKRLALEDERQRIYEHQLRQQQQQRQQGQGQQGQQGQQQEDKDGFDEFIKEIQDEIPVIKEKVIEAGTAAKKKVLDMYNQFKASRANNNGGNAFSSGPSGSVPVSNAQYRGLPSDRDDDYLLSDDMTALHLSDQDVYAQTGARGNQLQQQEQQRNKNYYDYQGSNFQTHESIIPSNVIHVNPPFNSQQYKTSTSETQLLADEEFARQLAQDDEVWAQQQRQQQQQTPPAMPPRQISNNNINNSNSNNNNNDNNNTSDNSNNNRLSNPSVVIAPKSPLEEYDEHDNSTLKKDEDVNVKSYVIGDDDDSEDGLVDLEDDDEDEVDTKNQNQKPNQKTMDSPKNKTK